MLDFELGDRIKIREASRFYKQSHEIGTIFEIETEEYDGNEGETTYRVRFDNGGYKNAYWKADLKLVKITNWKEVIEDGT